MRTKHYTRYNFFIYNLC